MATDKNPKAWQTYCHFLELIIGFHYKKLNLIGCESKDAKINPPEKTRSRQYQLFLSLWKCELVNYFRLLHSPKALMGKGFYLKLFKPL